MDRSGLRGFFLISLYASFCAAAPGMRPGSLEAASLQLGALQAQAQYPASALQGARSASRSAASCLVTAVQYTHGQQIWRADPCEFCLCLDGEMFCWWQDCPPTAPGPCPGPQPFSLCGNSSGTLVKRPSTAPKRNKKIGKKDSEIKKKPKQLTKNNLKPLVTKSQDVNPTYRSEGLSNKTLETPTSPLGEKPPTTKSTKLANHRSDKATNEESISIDLRTQMTSVDYTVNYTSDIKHGDLQTPTTIFENSGKTKEGNWAMSSGGDDSLSFKIGVGDRKDTTKTSGTEIPGCLVMGVHYHVGQSLPSTGSCLACRCAQQGTAAPRVTCAPRGCATLETGLLEDTGAF